MPIMDGEEATKNIRNLKTTQAQVPIIAMTAHAYVAQDHSYLDKKMDDCIIKPFEPKTLIEKIIKYLKN